MSKKDDKIKDLTNDLRLASETEDLLCTRIETLTEQVYALESEVKTLQVELEIQSIPLVTNIYTETTKTMAPVTDTIGNTVDVWIDKVKTKWSNFKVRCYW